MTPGPRKILFRCVSSRYVGFAHFFGALELLESSHQDPSNCWGETPVYKAAEKNHHEILSC